MRGKEKYSSESSFTIVMLLDFVLTCSRLTRFGRLLTYQVGFNWETTDSNGHVFHKQKIKLIGIEWDSEPDSI